MNHFSLRGVLRVYGGPFLENTTAPLGAPQPQDIHDGHFSVARAIRWSARGLVGVSPSPLSVLEELRYMASDSRSFDWEECTYGTTASYLQTWTSITVPIALNSQAGVSASTIEALKPIWEAGIENTWSDKFGCTASHEVTCPIALRVAWVASGHPVNVFAGSGRENSATWYTTTDGLTAAHETGHLFGLPDEYTDPACPDRSPIDPSGVMGGGATVRTRYMARFAQLIHSQLVDLT